MKLTIFILFVLFSGATGAAHAAAPPCGGVARTNRVFSISTGAPALRSQHGKAQVRIWAMIQVGGPEFKAAFGRLENDCLNALSRGSVNEADSILALNDVLVNLNVSDQQRAVALVAADFFRNAEGELRPGLMIAFGTPGSSSWLVTARAGNRGFFVEIVAARNAVVSGIRRDGGGILLVQKGSVVGFGKRLTTSTGRVVEGDLVEAIAAGERWIDFKAIDASFDLDQLDRVGDAMAEGRISEYVFAVEEGARVPSDWLARLNEINPQLIANGRRPIQWGIVAGF